MEIIKNGKIYAVNECKDKWTVKSADERLTVSYNVPKDICATFDELSSYVQREKLF